MIRKTSIAILVCTFVFTAALSAQAPPMPKPAPELKKLDYFLGNWKLEGDSKPGPMGPGGKFTGNEHYQWMDGGFFMQVPSDFKGASMPDVKGLSILGYDSDKKVYTYHEFNSMGEAFAAEGVLEGDTWTWNSEQKMGGQVVKSRFVIKQVSPTSFTMKYDMAIGGGELTNAMEGKATKQ